MKMYKDYKHNTCNDCEYANKERMKCNPQSKDCRNEYDLEKSDFLELKYCCFYKRKEQKMAKKLCSIIDDVCPHKNENCDGCELHNIYLDYKIMAKKARKEEESKNE